MRANLRHYSMIVVDVVGFSRRDDRFQRRIRLALKEILADAYADAGILPGQVVTEDRGDGKAMLISADVSAYRLIDPLVSRIDVGLRQHNEASSEQGRIRLRMALHQGQVQRDADGWVGSDLNTVFRLADCAPLRAEVIRIPDSSLFLVVSDSIYQSIVRHGHGAIDPRTYHQVRVENKETETTAWIHVPATTFPGSAGRQQVQPPPTVPPALPPSIGGGMFTGPVVAGGDVVGRDKHTGGSR
jgi:class 3 adenylate cyclase